LELPQKHVIDAYEVKEINMADKYTDEQVETIKNKILAALENVIDPELQLWDVLWPIF